MTERRFRYNDLVTSPRLVGFNRVGRYDDDPANDGFVWVGGAKQSSILIHEKELVKEN
jgi:hypothetical protein